MWLLFFQFFCLLFILKKAPVPLGFCEDGGGYSCPLCAPGGERVDGERRLGDCHWDSTGDPARGIWERPGCLHQPLLWVRALSMNIYPLRWSLQHLNAALKNSIFPRTGLHTDTETIYTNVHLPQLEYNKEQKDPETVLFCTGTVRWFTNHSSG